ncbi:hypothetical protein CYMTET_25796 [Cymbomonas tetramitiformis]|uniref:Uncharacterized protein n=1 Tax=Cymbomonas tetramitiformis TaxID=36881 RepID=A0AAE0FTV0_9CHLO|nr:hypothetical protein CYMTET_25796 [Cymbomonas tetramitiformis]
MSHALALPLVVVSRANVTKHVCSCELIEASSPTCTADCLQVSSADVISGRTGFVIRFQTRPNFLQFHFSNRRNGIGFDVHCHH